MLTLANPLGLLALLGIPAVLAIHFLQRKSVVLPVSTLFLLAKTQRESASGRRFDRLMNSIPLWMQLLAVLLLAWFLAEPRFSKPDSIQRVAIVLDSSASMSVFKEQAIAKLKEKLPGMKGMAARCEFLVFESAPGRTRLYAGESADDLLATLADWKPRDGVIDPSHALRLARSLVSREGIIVYVTDTPSDALPFDARQLSVGDAVENVGFTGISFANEEGALIWRALVRNYGKEPADRTWAIETTGGTSEPKSIHLDPGGMISLQAAFPANTDRARLVLSPDRFALDDILPMVKPRPKPLTLFSATAEDYADLTKRMLRAIEAIEPVNDAASADLSLTSYDPLDPGLPSGNSIVFIHDTTRNGAYLNGGIVAAPHPLMEGLNWQALLVRETINLERSPADEVLLWQDTRALVFLRTVPATAERPAARQLCFNFDLKLSNAATQPAFIVLLHRFAETVRDAKVAPATANLETGEQFRISARIGTKEAPAPDLTATVFSPDGKETGTHRHPANEPLEAPRDPGYLAVKQGDMNLLDASVHFGDTREADFTACGASDTLDSGAGSATEKVTNEDPWWRVWILLLVAALLVSWHYVAGKPAAASPVPNPEPSPR